MTPPVKCILNPHEAELIVQDLQPSYDYLQKKVCPDLTRAEYFSMQSQLKTFIPSNKGAIAFLWRGNSVEEVLPYVPVDLGDCSESLNSPRCEALGALGYLSQASAEIEESSGLLSDCDWEDALYVQNQKWDWFYQENKDLRISFRIPEEVKNSLSPDDKRLLGTLALISHFLYENQKTTLVDNSNTLALACSQKADCNVISTRALDLLYRTGISHPERVEVLHLPGHVVLRVNLVDGSFVYFNNAKNFLPSNSFIGLSGSENFLPAWAILASNLGDLSCVFMNHYDDRARFFSEASLMINPNSVVNRVNYGIALEKDGNIDGAIREYEEALVLDSNNAVVHNNLSRALGKKSEIQPSFENSLFHYFKDARFSMILQLL